MKNSKPKQTYNKTQVKVLDMTKYATVEVLEKQIEELFDNQWNVIATANSNIIFIKKNK